jgi:hypothetical protein
LTASEIAEMNATVPGHIALPARADASARRSEPRYETAGVSLTSWPLPAILTAFWLFVTLSNAVYGYTMSMVLDPDGTNHSFWPWNVRVLMHVFLFPVLFGCIWASLKIGWRPAWRAVPVQVLLGLAFSVLAYPLLELSGYLVGGEHAMMMAHGHAISSWSTEFRKALPGWIASATLFVLNYGFALALITGFALYRRFRDSELRLEALERAWSGARLAALRLQLSPHTLFNLLHTIRGQIGWDPAAAQAMIVQLGDLLRRLLVAGEREFARLTDELQFVELYLSLQQKRFADRLSVSLPQTPLPSAWVPSLILQPLVENAVAHGLGGHSGPVAVRVEAHAAGDALILRVINTVAPDHTAGGAGIGLRNVRERLAVQFGDRAQFSSGRDSTGDWIAEIRMPLLKEPDAARERGGAVR